MKGNIGMPTPLRQHTVPTPVYLENYIGYLGHVIQTNGYSGSKIENIEELPKRGRVNQPIIHMVVSLNGRRMELGLHFRQTPSMVRTEVEAIAEARKRGVNAPRVIFADPTVDNELGSPFIVQEYVPGVPLADRMNAIVENPGLLADQLLKLHCPQQGTFGPPSPALPYLLMRRFSESELARALPNTGEWFPRFEQVIEYQAAHTGSLSLDWYSLVHGGLQPDKIIVAHDGTLWFVNWEYARLRDDYCFDLAMIRFGIYGGLRGIGQAQFSSIVKRYEESFGDSTIQARLQFYTGARCLFEIVQRGNLKTNIQAAQLWLDAFVSCWDDSLPEMN